MSTPNSCTLDNVSSFYSSPILVASAQNSQEPQAPADSYTSQEPNALAQQIKGIISNMPQCTILSDGQRDSITNNILHNEDLCIRQPQFMPALSAPSSKLDQGTLVCERTLTADERIQEIINDRCAPLPGQGHSGPQSGDHNNGFFKFISEQWKTMLWILGSATAGVLALLRIIKTWKIVGKEMEEAGKAVNALRKGLISLHRAFGELGSTIKGFFVKKPAEKTKPVEPEADTQSEVRRRMRATNPFLKPASIGIDSLVGEPKLSVVLSQLEGLKDDKDNVILAKRLSALDKNGLLYLAYEVISGWYELVSKNEDSQKTAKDYIQNSLPLYGGLPSAFVRSVVTDFFAQKKDVEIRAAAGEWARETARKIAAEVNPTAGEVERQLWTDTAFGGDVELVKYLANAAIDEWSNYDIDRKADFIIDLTRSTNKGALPFQLLRVVKKVRLGEAKRLAPIYAQIVSHKQELADPLYFKIARAKAERLLGAYEWLPRPLQKALGGRDSSGHLSSLFMELAGPLLNFGINERLALSPAEKPWEYDANNEEITPEGINLSRIKDMLVKDNKDLAYYPNVLDARAKTIVDIWNSLPDDVRRAFLAQDKANGAVNHGGINLSVTYIKFWLKLNAGIGISERPAIEPGGSSGSSGTGSPSPSGGTPSLRQAQVMPIPSGAQSAAVEEISSYEFEDEITGIDEETDWTENVDGAIEDGALTMIGEEYQEDPCFTDAVPFDPIFSWEGQFAGAFAP